LGSFRKAALAAWNGRKRGMKITERTQIGFVPQISPRDILKWRHLPEEINH
jgi:hypothetical protein